MEHFRLETEVIEDVRKAIGPVAALKNVLVAERLPKTRSGKIMRRILKKVAQGDFAAESFGDTSTLADPTTVNTVVEGAKELLNK